MEISGISGTSVSASLSSRTSSKIDVGTTDKTEKSREAEHSHRRHGHRRHHDHGHHARALGVFRQELKQSLMASFRATFAASQSGYSRIDDPASADAVAADTLGAAQRIVAEEPVAASKSVIKFRQKVEEAASYTREVVGNDDDLADVEGAVGRVLDGLNKIERESARNVQSSASVLAVETESRQRSTISIRTQEGDIVKLNLKQSSSLFATDVAAANEGSAATATQVDFSSNSRLSLRIEGDLNEAELGAIRNVFSQAESMANEFFAGDLFAALDLATAFEYDSEQLTRVNMSFRSRQVSNTSFASVAAAVREPLISTAPEAQPTGVAATPELAAQRPDATAEQVVATDTPVEPVPVEAAVKRAELAEATPDNTALTGFYNLVSSFLRSVAEGFEFGTGTTSRFHFSQSFKLEILKSVLDVAAPVDSTDDVDLATSLIEGMAGANESETVTET